MPFLQWCRSETHVQRHLLTVSNVCLSAGLMHFGATFLVPFLLLIVPLILLLVVLLVRLFLFQFPVLLHQEVLRRCTSLQEAHQPHLWFLLHVAQVPRGSVFPILHALFCWFIPNGSQTFKVSLILRWRLHCLQAFMRASILGSRAIVANHRQPT